MKREQSMDFCANSYFSRNILNPSLFFIFSTKKIESRNPTNFQETFEFGNLGIWTKLALVVNVGHLTFLNQLDPIETKIVLILKFFVGE
jgi:hypothetical protein